MANVLNLKVDMIESEEGPALGGAMLAAVACGEYKNVEEAAEKLVKVIGTVEPEPELVEKYEAKYQQFRQYGVPGIWPPPGSPSAQTPHPVSYTHLWIPARAASP